MDHASDEAKISPMFTWRDDRLRCRANSSLVRKGYQVGGHEMDRLSKCS